MSDGRSSASATHTAGLQLMSSGREIMPALGPSWASCVDVRLFLSRPGIKDAPAPPSTATLVNFHSTAVLDVHAHQEMDPQQRENHYADADQINVNLHFT